ncbi:MAG: CehA/McbA family metallohydrolase [Planctomycetota bacterium]|nr:CehA/McbA family metallohydrolase [Planctomycetota bacterium]
MVDWSNPYQDRRGGWLKGNLHAHTSPASGCAEVAPERVIDLYIQAGFDFLAISDHMVLSEHQSSRIVLIPGVEWHSEAGEHTGIYSTDTKLIRSTLEIADHRNLLDHLRGKEALVILNHPNWEMIPHYRREVLESKRSYDGIEIYNAVIEGLVGCALSTDKWDYLLASGRRVLGFAGDDLHAEAHVGLAWICVRTASAKAEGILSAIRQGNFYCSSGVEITDIRAGGGLIEIETANAEEIHAISDGGRRVARVTEKAIAFRAEGDSPTYVRFEAHGYGSAMAWTQPFFLRNDNA